MRTNKKLVVFDLDGTLNRTECYAVPAMLEALNDFGITSFNEQDIQNTFGARDEDTIKKFFGDKAGIYEQEYWQKVDWYSKTKYINCYKTYEDVLILLEKLKTKGYLLAICSNADLSYIKFVSDKLLISEYVDFYQPLEKNLTKDDTLKLLLNKVSPDKAVMVGDRYFDMKAARSNNIPFIGCLYGFGEKGELNGAEILVKSSLKILDAVEELLK